MTKILNPIEVSEDIYSKLSKKLEGKNYSPKLATFRVGNDPGTISYEKSINKKMSECGIVVSNYVFSQGSSLDFEKSIIQSNSDDSVDAILIFRPLPKGYDENRIFSLVSPNKDVDGLNPINLGNLGADSKSFFASCSAEAIIDILDFYGIDLRGLNVCIINNSNVIGKPLSLLLTNRFATVSICHKDTKSVSKLTKISDLIITACGRKNFLTKEMIDPKAIIIDAGINYDGLSYSGDCSVDLLDFCSMITSKTKGLGGGVGPVTTAVLASHVVLAAEKNNKI